MPSSRSPEPAVAALADDEVHLWLARPEPLDPGRQAQAEALLSAEERERHGRLRFARHRCEYLTAHVLLRRSLSRYARVAPEAWQFESPEDGKPQLRGPAGAPPLGFSLSHTAGLVAVAVALDRELGVDVEARSRRLEPLEIAERYFSAEEAEALRALPDSAREARFLELWTLKEAYAKARGDGIAELLSRVRFRLGATSAPRAHFAAELEDAPEHWHFTLHRPGPDHQLALAARRREEPALRLRLYEGPGPGTPIP